ncbi:MAG: DUF6524 family protein [Gammaproteobacteria bacterium]|nr:DUF6524 family protein [Gammaproteobacteria bacterium]
MAGTNEMTWFGIGIRFLIALIIVFATYNPSGYSFYDWLLQENSANIAFKIFIGVVLLIGWAIYIRATRRSLGMIGITLAIAFFAALLWVLIDLNIIPADTATAITYIALFILGCLLATGMCWSHIRRRMTGQLDVDEIES